MTELSDIFASLAGQRIPGGCEQCDAYQTVHPDPQHSRITFLNIHHDDDCPELARHEGRSA